MSSSQFPGQRPPDWQPPQGVAARKKPNGCLIAGAVFAGLVLIGMWMGDGEQRAKQGERAKVAQTGGDIFTKPVFELTALQLSSEYEANEVAAKQAYGEKRIKVTGVVAEIGLDAMQDPYVRFDLPLMATRVVAYFPKEESDGAAALAKGAKVAAICDKSSRTLGIIVLRECALVR